MLDVSTASILLVDDNPTNLLVLKQALKELGLSVRIATDGEEALEQVQRKLPDLILLDVMMPGIDGFETCRQLKSNSLTQDIPVIFMTALTDTNSKVKGLSAGAADYITKPFEQEEVLARVKVHLQLRFLSHALQKTNESLEQLVQERTADLQKAQVQLVKQEKMSTLGQLVAGIAHEINNPIGYIVGNLDQVKLAFKDLLGHLRLYQETFPHPGKAIERNAEKIDLEYLLADLPHMILSMKLGCDRIQNISTSLRTFSRGDQDCKIPFNIHDGIDSTVQILKYRLNANERRPAIKVIREYGQLPLVKCFPGQLNQVFMNILANAIDAIEEGNVERSFDHIKAHPNWIKIQTELSPDRQQVVIRIQDNGIGISEEVKQHIFEQLFTTKAVGKGTGLGLAISQQIVVEKHGGALDVRSVPGQGSEFIINLSSI
ncbi:histidine kinase,Response regulator receiver domain protein,histidine kinase [Cylindrospermum stagnale PCC 7417]|uniref:histidine kinase n=1 Tax=Cylindrospermum stagnale PCC 7417 TaxID=56107 RepID=K9WRI1_9NOST|nr:response regulator [Cylindrospermum stagnale]AFZ22808.1 histidine kinase,Response regulator receiver domain protein,histidine kinase [Cylindrospermum stagnale PCC 7417]